MSSSYLDKLRELEHAVLSSKASLAGPVRRQILERARDGARDPSNAHLPEWIEMLTDAVVKNPAAADVDRYLESGRSEAEIFEVVVVAAVGVALARADRVLPALPVKP